MNPWTAAHQSPLSVRFLRQEHWSGLLFHSPGIFLTQELIPCFLLSGGFFNHCATREAPQYCVGLCQRLFPNFKPLIKPACNKFYSDLKHLWLHHGRQPNFPAMLVAELTMQLTLSFKVGKLYLSVPLSEQWPAMATLANELGRNHVCPSWAQVEVSVWFHHTSTFSSTRPVSC